jgi:hypothetical protein
MSKYEPGSAQEWTHLVRRVHVRNPDVSLGTLRTFSNLQLRALLGDPDAQFRANQLGITPQVNCGCQDFTIRLVDDIGLLRSNVWDESKHPRDDDGKWTDAGGGGSSSGSSASGASRVKSALKKVGKAALATAGVAAGISAGFVAGSYLGPIALTAAVAAAPRAVGADFVVASLARASLELGSKAAVRFGQEASRNLASVYGAWAGAAAGGAGAALAVNADDAAPQFIADLGPVIEAVAKGDPIGAIAALKAWREKYKGDEEAIASLKEIAAEEGIDEADIDTSSFAAGTEDDLQSHRSNSMQPLDEAVRDRLPNITDYQLRTFSRQQKQAIVRGMPATRVNSYGAFAGQSVFIPISKAEAEAAAEGLSLGNGGSFVRVNTNISEGTREQRMRNNAVHEDAGPPSSFVPNQRIANATRRVR